MNELWHGSAGRFLLSVIDEGPGTARSKAGGPITLYGTCYATLGLLYLGLKAHIEDKAKRFIRGCQDPETGLLIGPELQGFKSAPGVLHTFEHLSWHSSCAALPFCQDFKIDLPYPLVGALFLLDRSNLTQWLDARDLKNAWFEGNNILFAGQFLIHLRDKEKHPEASTALNYWFEWLDRKADPKTSLWGTNGFCSPMEAVYGGYHQLLVYWHENRAIVNPQGLIDTVISLRHPDGGFNPNGNAGACEDVDSVDILVNCYKRWDYRRAEIRRALWQCVDHILATQNPDGGFPYKRNQAQSHMGIPGTEAAPNVSCTFPTWFRIHTLALCHEIIPEHPQLRGVPFRFSSHLSMGWHKSPPGWRHEVSAGQLEEEARIERGWRRQKQLNALTQKAKWIKTRAVHTMNRVKIKAGAIRRQFIS
jgi:hypothetical protein